MLQPARGLTRHDLQAVAALERSVVAVDGGRLKLEWETLEHRDPDEVQDLLWWEGEQLAGFLGRYAYGGSIELAGMVAPSHRRRGIATALLDAALPLCSERGERQVVLVVPRHSVAGQQLALRRGGALEHSEYALALSGEPAPGPADPEVQLRRATPADAPALAALLTAAFGRPPSALDERIASRREQLLVIERAGSCVGTVRLTRQGAEGGVFGFAVAPELQGHGIGRDVLRRVCRQLRAEGATRVGLEVAVDNDRALGLYTSVGFTEVTTEDYYLLPVPPDKDA